MAARKVAIVTGGNKGIGLSIVRGLCRQFDGDVYLTARDESRGRGAVSGLQREGLQPRFHQLDVQQEDSVWRLMDFIGSKYGGVDVVVNNAGIAFPMTSTDPTGQEAQKTVDVNYFGLLHVTEAAMPLLRPGARVVNMSGKLTGAAFRGTKKDLKQQLLSTSTVDELSSLMADYVRLAKEGKAGSVGWPKWSYAASKLGVSFLTPLLQQQVTGDILINSCCPGYTKTDMTHQQGSKTPDQGAETPLYAALLPPNTEHPKGEFLSDKAIIDWQKAKFP